MKPQFIRSLLLLLLLSLSLQAADSLAVLSRSCPPVLRRVIQEWVPLQVLLDGKPLPLTFEETAPGMLTARSSELEIKVRYEVFERPAALRWSATVTNNGRLPVTKLRLLPLMFRLDVEPKRDLPRVRHFGGSNHYDGTYPPRAFREYEELIATHDHSKPVEISSGNASADKDVPLVQFAVGRAGEMAGFTAGFEWSGNWNLSAGWERTSFEGQARPSLLVTGNVGLGMLELAPQEALVLPRVHLVFTSGASGWDRYSNDFRQYLRAHLIPRLAGNPPLPPVSYDHWFGIHQNFDLADMKQQATRAAELGVEYFCLDAGWYRCKHWGDGIGNWFSPDPQRFPGGDAGVRELSAHVRKAGMMFGLWHLLELARPGSDFAVRYPDLFRYNETPTSLRLDLPAGRAAALERLRYWCREWNVRWIRWGSQSPEWAYKVDPSGKLALQYFAGYYEVIDTLRREFPDLYIEGCQGGGQKLDLGMVARTDGTWLSDHTADADVSRFNQTGALRIWPAQYLNSAVRVHRKTGDAEATSHNLISRMAGAFSFNGDIAQWSPNATALARQHVTAYKSFRHLLNGPVSFPLPQPRHDREWDAVVFGEERGHQLLFAFRLAGPERVFIEGQPSKSAWKLALGNDRARLVPTQGGYYVYLDRNSSAVWQR